MNNEKEYCGGCPKRPVCVIACGRVESFLNEDNRSTWREQAQLHEDMIQLDEPFPIRNWYEDYRRAEKPLNYLIDIGRAKQRDKVVFLLRHCGELPNKREQNMFPWTLAEIGRKFNISPQQVHEIDKRTGAKIEKYCTHI